MIMRPVKYGRVITGENIHKVLPRFEYFELSKTVLEIKRFFFEKLKFIYKDFENRFKTDEELNDGILVQIYDNLPYEKAGMYSTRKA